MTNRTVQFWGQGYGSTPCQVTARIDGVEVFSGPVPTLDEVDIYRQPDEQQVLFTFEIPMTSSGALPLTLEISEADIYLGQVMANYSDVSTDLTPISAGPDKYHSIFTGEPRTNVVVTGAAFVGSPPPEPRPADLAGTWCWEIETAPGKIATFSCDLNVKPGAE